MLRLLKWLLLLPIAAIVVIFAIANRHMVKVVADPFGAQFPGLTFEAPFYLVIFATLLLGVFIGGIAAWLRQGKHRRACRILRADERKLREENQSLRQQVSAARPVGGAVIPHPGNRTAA